MKTDYNKKYNLNWKSPIKSFLELDNEEYTMTSNRVLVLFLRISIFVIYAYFGIWKIFGLSPAEKLVTELHRVTPVSVIPIHTFLVLLGILEVIVGILMLAAKGKLFRISLIIFGLHMFTTFAALISLPSIAFPSFPIPSIEAQYVIKNLVLIGSVLAICQLEKNQRILQRLTK